VVADVIAVDTNILVYVLTRDRDFSLFPELRVTNPFDA
jgi:hypothetical protein